MYNVICEWNLQFVDTVIRVKSRWMCSGERVWKVTKYLSRRKFSHVLEMSIAFITDLRYMTYEHYLEQPKPMIEWLVNKNIYKNAELLKKIENPLLPLRWKYRSCI